MSKKVLVAIANGSEDIETACIIDVLRRAQIDVTVASVNDIQITAARGMKIVADCKIADCTKTAYDLIALPGGMPGAENLRDSQDLTGMLQAQNKDGRLLAAICASPAVVFHTHGFLKNRRATAFPGFTAQFDNAADSNEKVVVDGNIITSQGPATALAFSLKLVALLTNEKTSKEIAQALLFT